MSNLVINGQFITPLLEPNTEDNIYDNFRRTPSNEAKFIWGVYRDVDITLINGGASTNFNYPLPSSIGQIQILDLSYMFRISQSIIIPLNGEYEISFYYATRDGYLILPIQINIDEEEIGTITTGTPAYVWTKFTTIINFEITKKIVLTIQSLSNYSLLDERIGIADVNIKLVKEVGNSLLKNGTFSFPQVAQNRSPRLILGRRE